MEKKQITKDMSIAEVVQKSPASVEIILSHGLHCIGCPATMFETLEQGAKAHGMSDKEINNLVKELNKSIKKK